MNDIEDIVDASDSLVVRTFGAVKLVGAVAVELGELRSKGRSGAAVGGAELLE